MYLGELRPRMRRDYSNSESFSVNNSPSYAKKFVEGSTRLFYDQPLELEITKFCQWSINIISDDFEFTVKIVVRIL